MNISDPVVWGSIVSVVIAVVVFVYLSVKVVKLMNSTHSDD